MSIARLIRGYEVVGSDIYEGSESKRYYYQLDEQYSTAFMTNRQGIAENAYEYDAFGQILSSKEQVHNRITYTGQQYEPLTQQYYLRVRFYNPILGRFMHLIGEVD